NADEKARGGARPLRAALAAKETGAGKSPAIWERNPAVKHIGALVAMTVLVFGTIFLFTSEWPLRGPATDEAPTEVAESPPPPPPPPAPAPAPETPPAEPEPQAEAEAAQDEPEAAEPEAAEPAPAEEPAQAEEPAA